MWGDSCKSSITKLYGQSITLYPNKMKTLYIIKPSVLLSKCSLMDGGFTLACLTLLNSTIKLRQH